jgi:hypothetical protein
MLAGHASHIARFLPTQIDYWHFNTEEKRKKKERKRKLAILEQNVHAFPLFFHLPTDGGLAYLITERPT